MPPNTKYAAKQPNSTKYRIPPNICGVEGPNIFNKCSHGENVL